MRISSFILTVAAPISLATLTAFAQPARGIVVKARADAFSGSKAADERAVSDVKLCWCPPGRFRMGSPPDEPDRRPDEAQVEVTLTKGFWMGKYEVTQGQWKRVVGKFPGKRTKIAGEGDDFPVYWINFDDAEGFCRGIIVNRARKNPALVEGAFDEFTFGNLGLRLGIGARLIIVSGSRNRSAKGKQQR